MLSQETANASEVTARPASPSRSTAGAGGSGKGFRLNGAVTEKLPVAAFRQQRRHDGAVARVSADSSAVSTVICDLQALPLCWALGPALRQPVLTEGELGPGSAAVSGIQPGLRTGGTERGPASLPGRRLPACPASRDRPGRPLCGTLRVAPAGSSLLTESVPVSLLGSPVPTYCPLSLFRSPLPLPDWEGEEGAGGFSFSHLPPRRRRCGP